MEKHVSTVEVELDADLLASIDGALGPGRSP